MKVASRKLENSASGEINFDMKNKIDEKLNNASDLYWQQQVDRILKVQEHNRKVHSRKEIVKDTNENSAEQVIMLASYEQRMLAAQQRRQEQYGNIKKTHQETQDKFKTIKEEKEQGETMFKQQQLMHKMERAEGNRQTIME